MDKLNSIFNVVWIASLILFATGLYTLDADIVIIGFVAMSAGLLGAFFTSDIVKEPHSPRLPF